MPQPRRSSGSGASRSGASRQAPQQFVNEGEEPQRREPPQEQLHPPQEQLDPARRARAAAPADKSVQQFRDALERSVTLSRDRIQEVADDAVKRGRMTRGDANKLVSDLVSRGRKQSDRMLRDLEKMLRQARTEAERRTKQARREAERRSSAPEPSAAKPARAAEATAGRAARAARDAADQPLAQADRLRRRAGVGPTFPITAYDQLTAPQVKTRLADLKKGELRKVRDYERRNQNRKSVVAAIDKKLG